MGQLHFSRGVGQKHRPILDFGAACAAFEGTKKWIPDVNDPQGIPTKEGKGDRTTGALYGKRRHHFCPALLGRMGSRELVGDFPQGFGICGPSGF